MAIEEELVEGDSPAMSFADRGHISWKNSQTRMLIAHLEDNSILLDKQLNDNVVQCCHLVFLISRTQRILHGRCLRLAQHLIL